MQFNNILYANIKLITEHTWRPTSVITFDGKEDARFNMCSSFACSLNQRNCNKDYAILADPSILKLYSLICRFKFIWIHFLSSLFVPYYELLVMLWHLWMNGNGNRLFDWRTISFYCLFQSILEYHYLTQSIMLSLSKKYKFPVCKQYLKENDRIKGNRL